MDSPEKTGILKKEGQAIWSFSNKLKFYINNLINYEKISLKNQLCCLNNVYIVIKQLNESAVI